MLTLYYSPGSSSLAVHIALLEAELPHRLELVSLKDGQQLTPEYRQINPLGRIPALRTSDGEVLTEVSALLWYVAGLAPNHALLPDAGNQRVKAVEWMSRFGTALHPMFAAFFRPQRYTDDVAGKAALNKDAKPRFLELLRFVDRSLIASHTLGEQYSLCDAYALLFYVWGKRFEFPVHELPNYTALAQRVLARPAVRTAFEREGLAAFLAAAS